MTESQWEALEQIMAHGPAVQRNLDTWALAGELWISGGLMRSLLREGWVGAELTVEGARYYITDAGREALRDMENT